MVLTSLLLRTRTSAFVLTGAPFKQCRHAQVLLRRDRLTIGTVSRTCASSSCSSGGRKILFFGTDAFSLETLKTLHQCFVEPNQRVISRLEVCCTEMQTLVQVVKAFSLENGLRIHPWPPYTGQDDFDLGVVASFGHLIPERIINQFPFGILNVHASLLPRWRGASPIPHAILNGDKETGITIMQIKPKHFDVGNVLSVQRCPIDPDELRPDLEKKLAKIGADLMLEVIKDLDRYRLESKPQSDQGVTFAPKLTKSDFEVIWHDRASRQVYDQWRALSDLGKLYSFWQDTGVRVHLADIVHPDIVESLNIERIHPGEVFEPGRALRIRTKKDRLICIKCKTGWVSFRKFYYGPKKVMSPNDFFNGFISKQRDKSLYFVTSGHLVKR